MLPPVIIKEEPVDLDDYQQDDFFFNHCQNTFPLFHPNTLPLPADTYGKGLEGYPHQFKTIKTEPGVFGSYTQNDSCASCMEVNAKCHHLFHEIKTEPKTPELRPAAYDMFELPPSPVEQKHNIMEWEDTTDERFSTISDHTTCVIQRNESPPPIDIKCEIDENFQNYYPERCYLESNNKKSEPTANNYAEDDRSHIFINFFYKCPEWDSSPSAKNTSKEKNGWELKPKKIDNGVLQSCKPYLPKRLPCLLNLHRKGNQKHDVKPPVDLRSYSTIHALKKKVRIGASLAARLEPFKKPNKRKEKKLNYYTDTLEMDTDEF